MLTLWAERCRARNRRRNSGSHLELWTGAVSGGHFRIAGHTEGQVLSAQSAEYKAYVILLVERADRTAN